MINKITIKNSAKIINKELVIKRKNKEIDNIYNYLSSRAFDYFPKVLREDDDNIYYEYISDLLEPNEQKMLDLVNLISLLHNKTTFYKEVDLDYYKYIYEEINLKIDDTLGYYNSLMDNIEEMVYMSPSNYLIARNISIIYQALYYAKDSISAWIKMVENTRRVRLVTIHNNLKLEHYLKSDRPYLISWDKAKQDIPIYDLVSLYKNNYLDFDFVDILKIYLSKYPLKKEEMTLFLTIISIPDKIIDRETEYERVLVIRRLLDYMYKSAVLVEEYGIKQETNEG